MTKRSKFTYGLLAAIFFLVLITSPLQAQQTTATVVGTVTDATGAVVPDVRITAVNEATSLTRIAETGPAGEYTISLLPPGVYTLSAEREGFKKEVRTHITLQIDQVARIDFTLSLGKLEESITVTAEAPLLEKDTSKIGVVIEQRRITELPLNRRQFVEFALLTPGTYTDVSYGVGTQLQQAGPQISVNGARVYETEYTLDGVSLTDYVINGIAGAPSVDALEEFKVESSLYEASAGFKGGGHVNVATRSGGNDFHGSAFEFLRNDKVDAKNFFDPANEPIPPFRQNQFGATVSGRIWRDRTFFMGNYEGLRIRQTITKTFSVPTATMRTGDLSTFSQPVIDPVTGTPFPNNRIPADRINPIGRALVNLYPLPNLPGTVRNLVATEGRQRDDDQFTVRLDHHLGQNDTLMGRFSFFNLDGFDPFVHDARSLTGVSAVPGFGLSTKTATRNFVLSYTHVFSPRLINDFKFGFNRVVGGQIMENQGVDFGQQFGIQGVSRDPADFGYPFVSLGLFADIGDSSVPWFRTSNLFQFIDDVSYTRGKHDFKAGVVLNRVQFRPGFGIFNRGVFFVTGAITGNALGDLLLGYPTVGLVGLGSNRGAHFRSLYYKFYFGDNWRVTKNFTLNLGLRYELNPPLYSKRNKMGNVLLDERKGTAVMVIPSVDGRANTEQQIPQTLPIPLKTSEEAGLPRSLLFTDKNNVAPRLGFAWTPFGLTNTVVRGGYGLYYSVPPLVNWSALGLNPPFTKLQITIQPSPATLTFANALAGGAGLFSSFLIQPDTPIPYIQQWGLNIEQQFAQDFLFTIGYVGSKGTKLDFAMNLNQPESGKGVLGPAPVPAIGLVIAQDVPVGLSTYHSLQMRLTKRLSHGVAFDAAYTFAKSLDNCSSGWDDSNAVSEVPQDVRNLAAEKGRSSFDKRHRFVLSYTYDLPFGSGAGSVSKLLAGWRIGGITTLQSGGPLTAALSLDRAGTGNVTGAPQRPNLLRDPNLPASERTPDRWFDTGAFQLQPPFTFGNEGRNIIEGPGFINFDFSLIKDTRITENKTLQFRAEIFNIFNHPNFELPNRVFGSPDFGKVFSTAGSSRQMQFALKFLF